jgi:hypothetical protein
MGIEADEQIHWHGGGYASTRGIGREATPRLHARDPALEVLHNPWAEHDPEWLDRDQGEAALLQYRVVRRTGSHRGNYINQVRLAMVGWWSQADTHDFSCLDQFVFQSSSPAVVLTLHFFAWPKHAACNQNAETLDGCDARCYGVVSAISTS